MSAIPTQHPWRWIVALTVAWCAFHLAFNSIYQLVPDEAYYWTWSRHLAGGYLDHPPMVAYAIRAGVLLFGANEFAVRFCAAFLAAGTILAVALTAQRVAGDRAAFLAAIILLCSPLLSGAATIITPDTPTLFFTSLVVLSAVSVFKSAPRSWSRFGWWGSLGLSMGLALLSKYTSVLAGVAIAGVIFSRAEGRREFLRPGPWLALALAIVAFSPAIFWNRAHDWASFRFQLSHGLGEGETSWVLNLLAYIGGQFAVWTPVLAALTFFVLIHFWRRMGELTIQDFLLLACATLPLVFFAFSSLSHPVELNWPSAAYLPATVLLVRYIDSRPAPKFTQWTHIGIIVAAGGALLLHVPQLVALVPGDSRVPARWGDLYGWKQMAQEIDRLSPPGATVYCSTYESAAEATFYCAGRRQAWLLDSGRRTAFDYFDPPMPDPATQPSAVYVRNGPRYVSKQTGPPSVPAPKIFQSRFKSLQTEWWEFKIWGHSVRWRQFIVARNPADAPGSD